MTVRDDFFVSECAGTGFALASAATSGASSSDTSSSDALSSDALSSEALDDDISESNASNSDASDSDASDADISGDFTPENDTCGHDLAARRPLKPTGITETIDLGRRVLELAGKLGTAADRRRAPSFRLLAKQLVVPKGASSVWRAAAIYRLAERYPELYEYRHLGVGHLAVLLSLRGPVQLALLRKAERMRWSRRKLEAKVKRITEDRARGLDAIGPLLAELESQENGDELVEHDS